MQRNLPPDLAPLHVAIIMDGNGRWATRRGQARSAGHAAGARAVSRTVEAAARLGLGTLTLYAFSADNWSRPALEVRALMRLFRRYLAIERERCVRNGVRLSVIGRRDRLDPALRHAIEAAEHATAGGTRLHLRVAVDYSARDAIVAAAASVAVEGATRNAFARALATVTHADDAPDVDLLVRTGGEQRLSDFLLWECAYAELRFVPRLWPDFGEADLRAAIDDFLHRERRFGGLPAAAAG
jgi:undecaprenyl diphosphate synthase